MTGTIKRVVADRGFGFIKGENDVEYFFHRSSVTGQFQDLEEGAAVTFEVEEPSAKGPRANRVQLRDTVTA
jgi:CspA family cold shock protein